MPPMIPRPKLASPQDLESRAPPHLRCQRLQTPSHPLIPSLRRLQQRLASQEADMLLHMPLLQNCVRPPAAQAVLILFCAAHCCRCPPLLQHLVLASG